VLFVGGTETAATLDIGCSMNALSMHNQSIIQSETS